TDDEFELVVGLVIEIAFAMLRVLRGDRRHEALTRPGAGERGFEIGDVARERFLTNVADRPGAGERRIHAGQCVVYDPALAHLFIIIGKEPRIAQCEAAPFAATRREAREAVVDVADEIRLPEFAVVDDIETM